MVFDYEDASLDELKILIRQFKKIKAEYGQEKRPEIDKRIKQLEELWKIRNVQQV